MEKNDRLKPRKGLLIIKARSRVFLMFTAMAKYASKVREMGSVLKNIKQWTPYLNETLSNDRAVLERQKWFQIRSFAESNVRNLDFNQKRHYEMLYSSMGSELSHFTSNHVNWRVKTTYSVVCKVLINSAFSEYSAFIEFNKWTRSTMLFDLRICSTASIRTRLLSWAPNSRCLPNSIHIKSKVSNET